MTEVLKTAIAERLQRYESVRGRTTPEIEWRLWNKQHDMYECFKTKRDALVTLNICLEIEAEKREVA